MVIQYVGTLHFVVEALMNLSPPPLRLSINLLAQIWGCRWSKQAFIFDWDRWAQGRVIDLTLRWTTEEKYWSVLHRRKFWMWEEVLLWAVIKQAAAGKQSRQHIRPSSFQPALSSAACESAISVPRFLAFNSSPWQQEQPWLRQLARRQGEGTLPQTLTSEFTFLQPRPRLAKTLPRAIRYFLMNYISELKMKGLRVSQKHIAVGQQGLWVWLGCLFSCDRWSKMGGIKHFNINMNRSYNIARIVIIVIIAKIKPKKRKKERKRCNKITKCEFPLDSLGLRCLINTVRILYKRWSPYSNVLIVSKNPAAPQSVHLATMLLISFLTCCLLGGTSILGPTVRTKFV